MVTAEPDHTDGPLRGVRVLNLGTLLAGPVAATLLADFGAEVIKIEQPGVGDTLRGGPTRPGDPPRLFWLVEGPKWISPSSALNSSAITMRDRAIASVAATDGPKSQPGWHLAWANRSVTRSTTCTGQ